MIRAALLCLLTGPASACDSLRDLAFGGSTATLDGVATPGGACVAVVMTDGQRARVTVEEGDVVFGVEGRVDGQDDYAFVVEGSGRRVVSVTPAEGAAEAEPFALTISLGERAPEGQGGWRLDEGEGRAAGLAWIGERGGASVSLACGADTGLAMTYDGTGTVGLVRGPETGEGTLEVEVGGDVRRHPVRLTRYDGFDRYWEVVPAGDPAALLDDFAAGARLRLVDAEGISAGAVGLAGSARLRAAMARQCGL